MPILVCRQEVENDGKVILVEEAKSHKEGDEKAEELSLQTGEKHIAISY